MHHKLTPGCLSLSENYEQPVMASGWTGYHFIYDFFLIICENDNQLGGDGGAGVAALQ